MKILHQMYKLTPAEEVCQKSIIIIKLQNIAQNATKSVKNK